MGEKGEIPNVYILEYPGLTVSATLRQGTQRMYSCMSFNASGTMLATVGGAPDYMLTVWDWKNERVILRYRAFGQVGNASSRIYVCYIYKYVCIL